MIVAFVGLVLVIPASGIAGPSLKNGALLLNADESVNSAPGFISPASASGTLESKIEDFQKNTDEVMGKELAVLVDKASLGLVTTSSGHTLAPEQASASTTDGGYRMLRVPFVEEAGLLSLSGYSIFFDPSGEIVATGEMVLKQETEHSGRVAAWQDGTKVIDTMVDESKKPGNSDSSRTTTVFSWDKLNDCLASAGIASWAITAIGVACGAACAATVGIGCIVCATAVSGIAGATIGTCVGQAMAA